MDVIDVHLQGTSRQWSLYNAAQTGEKLLAMRLISEAVDFLQIPYEYAGNGRPHIGLDDMVKCCVIKVFNNFSTRRTMCELRLAYALGYIREIPHFNSISNYMQNEEMSPWLHRLYATLALPLASIEHTFAVDSTGFSTSKLNNWMSYRLKKRMHRDWAKLHIISGIQTQIIARAKITESRRHDSPYFERLVKDASHSFKIVEVCADAGYLSRDNCTVAEDVGARPFILPKSNTNLRCRSGSPRPHAWRVMLSMWRDNKELFLQHYHQRSNVESTFSAMKRKFLPYIRSKDETAQKNELLCKVACHNASVLCNAIFELDVKAGFAASKV